MKTTPVQPKSGMKSTSAKSKAVFLLLLFPVIAGLLAFLPQPEKSGIKHLYGTWRYTEIIRPGASVGGFAVSDTMLLAKTTGKKGRFSYHIGKLHKDAAGSLELIRVPADSSPYMKALAFSYQLPATGNRRIFNIMLLKKDSLVIREGQTLFCYRKADKP